MDDLQNIPDSTLPENITNAAGGQQLQANAESTLAPAPAIQVSESGPPAVASLEGVALRRRNFRQNLYLLLALALAAFVLTSWILVRVDSPFGIFASGPQEIVRAQLRALDRGELRPAYDMFSPRYRAQVSFSAWHQLCVSHWRMFHANVVHADGVEPIGANVQLEIFLRGADATNYRARFTLVRTNGRWWIDDVHWMEEPSARDFWRA